jgi:hypothetical protein
MKIQIDFDTDDLLAHTTAAQDTEIADELASKCSDDKIVSECIDRRLLEDVYYASSAQDQESLKALIKE